MPEREGLAYMRTCFAGNRERRIFPYAHSGGALAFAAIALAFASVTTTAVAQTTPPSAPPASAPPSGNPGNGTVGAAPTANAAAGNPTDPPGAGPSPSPSQQGAPTAPTQTPPTPAAPPSGYPQPPPPAGGPQPYGGYPQGAPPPGYAPPSYGPPGYAQPSYGQPGVSMSGQGDPGAAARGFNEPPLPAPPKRRDLLWSVRFDLLQLIYGKLSGEVEYAFAPPFSVALGPEYIFSDTRRDRTVGDATGFGFHADFAMWVEGRPMRGFYVKAHAEHNSVTFKSPVSELSVPATKLGFIFGSQSIYGGWFTLNGGIGVVYDFQSEDRYLDAKYGFDSLGRPTKDVYLVPASGLFGNGFDLMTQLQIGGSF